MKKINRREFLQIGGSAALGALFIGGAGTMLWKLFTNPGELFNGSRRQSAAEDISSDAGDFLSPYRRTFGFMTEDEIAAMDVCDGNIVVATPNNIFLYGMDGGLANGFSTPSDVRDIAIYDGRIFVLYPSRIEVYGFDGALIQDWQACSDDADYCHFTVFDQGVYATDATNKIICHYRLDGSLAGFIKSPDGFVVPSYSFAITNVDGQIYCSNPGRHRVEVYTADGEFVRSFGKSGTDAGEFSGCCNPVQLAVTSAGELLTSEKGRPRISCYATDGTFRSVLLNTEMLGGGHSAYDMRVSGDRLIVAGGKKVQVFQYNSRLAAGTLCGSCNADCPMKVNL